MFIYNDRIGKACAFSTVECCRVISIRVEDELKISTRQILPARRVLKSHSFRVKSHAKNLHRNS